MSNVDQGLKDMVSVLQGHAEAVSAVSVNQELLAALKESVEIIHIFHGNAAWDIYCRCAPEMKRILAAIARTEAL